MQVGRNLSDENTPQLYLPKVQFFGLPGECVPDLIVTVSSQCSRIRMYSQADKVLHVFLRVPLRSCAFLPEHARKYFASESSLLSFLYFLRASTKPGTRNIPEHPGKGQIIAK